MSTDAIQASGGDYTDPEAWIAGLPAGAFTEDEIGECADEDFDTSNVTAGSENVSGFNYILRAQSGAAHRDTVQAFAYSTTGARLTNSTGYAEVLNLAEADMLVEEVQFKNTATLGYGICVNMQSGCIVKDCIMEGEGDEVVHHANTSALVVNCLIISRSTSGNGVQCDYDPNLQSCTIVVPSSITNTGGDGCAGTVDVNSTLVIGFADDISGSPTGDYNGSDQADMPGANSTDSITASDCFVDDDTDFNLKAGSAAIAAGNTNATYPNDYWGTVRPTTTGGSIGAVESLVATITLESHAFYANGTESGSVRHGAIDSVSEVVAKEEIFQYRQGAQTVGNYATAKAKVQYRPKVAGGDWIDVADE